MTKVNQCATLESKFSNSNVGEDIDKSNQQQEQLNSTECNRNCTCLVQCNNEANYGKSEFITKHKSNGNTRTTTNNNSGTVSLQNNTGAQIGLNCYNQETSSVAVDDDDVGGGDHGLIVDQSHHSQNSTTDAHQQANSTNGSIYLRENCCNCGVRYPNRAHLERIVPYKQVSSIQSDSTVTNKQNHQNQPKASSMMVKNKNETPVPQEQRRRKRFCNCFHVPGSPVSIESIPL